MRPVSLRIIVYTPLLYGFIACSSPTKDDNSSKLAKKENHRNFDTRKGKQEADFIVDAIATNYAG